MKKQKISYYLLGVAVSTLLGYSAANAITTQQAQKKTEETLRAQAGNVQNAPSPDLVMTPQDLTDLYTRLGQLAPNVAVPGQQTAANLKGYFNQVDQAVTQAHQQDLQRAQGAQPNELNALFSILENMVKNHPNAPQKPQALDSKSLKNYLIEVRKLMGNVVSNTYDGLENDAKNMTISDLAHQLSKSLTDILKMQTNTKNKTVLGKFKLDNNKTVSQEINKSAGKKIVLE